MEYRRGQDTDKQAQPRCKSNKNILMSQPNSTSPGSLVPSSPIFHNLHSFFTQPRNPETLTEPAVNRGCIFQDKISLLTIRSVLCQRLRAGAGAGAMTGALTGACDWGCSYSRTKTNTQLAGIFKSESKSKLLLFLRESTNLRSLPSPFILML